MGEHPELGRDGRWILLVEDDPELRKLLTEALEDEGLEVETAVDGWQALGSAMERRPSVVILDLMLPSLGGEDVAAAFRMMRADDVPIIIISGHHQASRKARAIRAFALLRKPFKLDELIATVRKALDRLSAGD